MATTPIGAASTGPQGRGPAPATDGRRVVALYLAVFVVLLAAGNLAFHLLPSDDPGHGWPDHPLLETLVRWDSGWYLHIAEDGYFYDGPGRQSAAAFFPAYPAAVRVVALLLRDTIIAGVAVTIASAIGASVLLRRWVEERLGRDVAWLTILLLFLYPFSYFLFGVVYSDALFLVSAVGAFFLVERDRPVLAGAVGAIACAGRPVGLAVLVGLVAVVLQRRGSLRALRLRDAGVLLAGLGFAAFVAYLWWRFDEPVAFSKVQTADGWNREISPAVIAKVDFYRRWVGFGVNLVNVALTLQALLSVGALALVPVVWKRLGWGYAIYVLGVIGLPLATSSDFLAMGRYLLPAFPLYAAAAHLLAPRTLRLRAATLLVSGALLIWFTTLFARWFLLS